MTPDTTRIIAALACCCAPALAAPQSLPSAWYRAGEWTAPPPSAAGTTQGNPGPDSAGHLVWHYEYAQGGEGLGALDPWYTRPRTPLVWDDSWYGNAPGWAVSDNFGVVVRPLFSTHQFQAPAYGGWHAYTSVQRWHNATGQPFRVDIGGSLWIGWSGWQGVTAPVDADVVIAHRAAATGAVTLLFARTIAKPTPNNVSESMEVTVDVPNVVVAAGDDLLVTHRARGSVPQSCWLNLFDRLCFVRVPIGVVYCSPGNVNSTGGPGRIIAHGSDRAADDDLTLRAYQLPLNSFAFFLTSRTQGFVAHPAGSAGDLCLGGAIGRYVGPNQVISVGSGLVATLEVGIARMPTPTGLVAAQPGETWSFQCWHRDTVNGLATSNFTDGVAVTLR